jgi:DNA-binding response OmpR family regulator
MITAYGDAETKRRALENSAEELLTKPIDFGTRAARSIAVLNARHSLPQSSEFAAVHESVG